MDNHWLTEEQLESITSMIPIEDIQDIYFSCDSGYYVKCGRDSKGIIYVLESGQMENIKLAEEKPTVLPPGTKVKIIADNSIGKSKGKHIGETHVIKKVDTYGTDSHGITCYDLEDENVIFYFKEDEMEVMENKGCIQGDICYGETQEATCCFECDKLESCIDDFGSACDNYSCEKYPEAETADEPQTNPCECAAERIEELDSELEEAEDYIRSLEDENDELLHELLWSKDVIISLQKELLEKGKIWQ